MANDNVARVWDLMEKISFCMLATWNGSELRSRPMDARVRRKENAIYFLTDARHVKDDEVARYPKLNLAFADTGAMKYVSLSGEAKVTNDRAKIKELWEPTAKAWWEFRRQSKHPLADRHAEPMPNIGIRPGKTVSMVKMVVAAATGSQARPRQK